MKARMPAVRTALRRLLLLAAIVASAPAAAEEEFEPELIDMRPEDGAVGFSMRNVAAPVSSIFRGRDHWYGERELRVETTPPGGLVDLFYVRSGFQKRFEQGETPLKVLLPSRIKAAERDVLTIRAFREGYRQNSVSIQVNSKRKRVVIDLEPLPNTLSNFASRYFAGRATLSFLTNESLTHRVQQAERGFAVILVETGLAEGLSDLLETVANPLVEGLFAQQLGEDLMVSVDLTDAARSGSVEPRTRESYDAARELHSFDIDLVPVDGGAEAVARARAALPKLTAADVSGCALEFDEALRDSLDPGELDRALDPHGSMAGPYLRAAMRRLGELSPNGRVEFSDGSVYQPGVPIELEMALTQAGDARGYLALLRRFAALVEGDDHVRATLRSLVAPEMATPEFDARMDAALEREQECAQG